MKDVLTRIAVLVAPVTLGILVCFCGIFLSLGFKTRSAVCFFSALGLLVLMRLGGWMVTRKPKK